MPLLNETESARTVERAVANTNNTSASESFLPELNMPILMQSTGMATTSTPQTG